MGARFAKSVARLSEQDQRRTRTAILRFQSDPRSPGLHFEKLRDHPGMHTIRVSRGLRILLRRVDRDEFELVVVDTHDVYDKL